MDIQDAINSRIDIRKYTDKSVSPDIKETVLEAARMASSGRNTQHWRFVVVDDDERLTELGTRSPSGGWVADAAFAVAVLTNPEWDFHQIDAGKAVTHMQLMAWAYGIGSCMCTTDSSAVTDFLEVPHTLDLTAIVGFGHPPHKVQGIKDRKRLDEIAFSERFGLGLGLDT